MELGEDLVDHAHGMIVSVAQVHGGRVVVERQSPMPGHVICGHVDGCGLWFVCHDMLLPRSGDGDEGQAFRRNLRVGQILDRILSATGGWNAIEEMIQGGAEGGGVSAGQS